MSFRRHIGGRYGGGSRANWPTTRAAQPPALFLDAWGNISGCQKRRRRGRVSPRRKPWAGGTTSPRKPRRGDGDIT